MDYERRYKELVDKFGVLLNLEIVKSSGVLSVEDIRKLIPELAESEDDRIRKDIVEAVELHKDFTQGRKEHIYAWLEKQGEQKFIDKIQLGKMYKCIASPRYSMFVKGLIYVPQDKFLCSLMNFCSDCFEPIEDGEQKPTEEYNITGIGSKNAQGKLGEMIKNLKSVNEVLEQQPTDKVKPKFHEGDWIIHQGTENIYQVVAIIDNQYQLKYSDNYTVQKCADVDRCARLWDITKDAKDGDVLCDYHKAYDNPLIFILKKFERVNFGLVRPSDYSSYCFLTAGDIQRFKEGTYHHKHNIKPATKEQRDTLIKAMTDAGYTFDFEKKELKKIEQNPTDEEMKELLHTEYEKGRADAIAEMQKGWSEEDEKIIKNIGEYLNRYGNYIVESNEEKAEDVYKSAEWLKSLKERIQP